MVEQNPQASVVEQLDEEQYGSYTVEYPLPEPPVIDHIITEDDAPVDNMPSEKGQRLLTEPLYSSWDGPGAGRVYLVAANVGVFATPYRPAIVPDVFLSLDVQVAEDWWAKKNRSYFIWEFGKPPDVAIEIVSNLRGHEAGSKIRDYAQIGTTYYAIFDPLQQLKRGVLRVYKLDGGEYVPFEGHVFPNIGLGLALWEGVYERKQATWLRWCDADGRLIPTGAERAETERQRADDAAQQIVAERQRAEVERQRAEVERQRAEVERQRVEKLLAQLRALGVEPSSE